MGSCLFSEASAYACEPYWQVAWLKDGGEKAIVGRDVWLFYGPGARAYAGQILGEHCRNNDLVVNPAKGKKLTNIRAAGSDENVVLTTPVRMSLEESIRAAKLYRSMLEARSKIALTR
ncbi:MAG: hypothetical protein ACFFB7_04545 [Candidatus Sifarchaeia archaeon]